MATHVSEHDERAEGGTRRNALGLLLASVAALCASNGTAHAIGKAGRVQLGQLALAASGGSTAADGALARAALQQLAWEVDKRTSIDVDPEPMALGLSDPQLATHPLLYWAGSEEIAPPSDALVERLERYLASGGMLFVDNLEGRRGGGFDRSIRALLARMRLASQVGRAPAAPAQLAPIPSDHVLYQTFYLIRGVSAVAPQLEVMEHEGRVAVLYSVSGLGRAWAGTSASASAATATRPLGIDASPSREAAIRLGVNLLMYALCLDYKRDQVHIPFLLKRRRWQAPEPPREGQAR